MGVKKNFAYNVMITMSSYIISLAIFPYVSRVLGVGLIGRVDFANNVVSYFSLFALLGVSAVGIREVAACGEDREKRSRVFSSIFGFIIFLTLLSLAIYILSIFFLPKFHEYKELLYWGAVSLFFTSLLIEWLYQGVENFRYIAIRTITIRFIYAILVFFLVKDKDDYQIYYILTVLSVLINAVVNILYSRQFVDFKLRYISLFKYAKEIISIGVYKILTSMYTTFNVVFLGYVCSDVDVGYYATSTKLFYILLGVMTAFTSVMLPRMSALWSSNNKEEFKSKLNSSFDLVFMFTLPIIIWSLVFTPQIIRLLSGDGFEGAITPMRIIVPLLFVTGIAQIIVIQILMPMKKDKVILVGSLAGACVGILSNIIWVRSFGAIGTALTLVSAEIVGDFCGLYYVLKTKAIIFPWKRMRDYLLASIPYTFICLMIIPFGLNYILELLLSAFACGVYFLVMNCFIIKNQLIRNIVVRKGFVK